jgi:hypothetical protein
MSVMRIFEQKTRHPKDRETVHFRRFSRAQYGKKCISDHLAGETLAERATIYRRARRNDEEGGGSRSAAQTLHVTYGSGAQNRGSM